MALHLTADIQEKLKSVLIEEGLVDAEVMQKSEAEAARTNRDLETVLINSDIVDEELIVHGIAYVSGVPYINLTSSIISQENLGLLRQDIAERLMAVPLAEVRNRLAVAMVMFRLWIIFLRKFSAPLKCLWRRKLVLSTSWTNIRQI